MSSGVSVDLAVIFIAILVLVSLANRIGVAYPIVLVIGGIALGYIPGIPPLQMPPDLVLVIFLPPLLYWESVNAPTSEFFSASGLWWILQLAVGLVIVTTVAVAFFAHTFIPAMAWGPAFVLGAIVSSTDEVAFAPIVERIRIPRHVIATIEGESLVNDATSLVLYGIGVTAIVTGTFSLPHAVVALAMSVAGAVVVGVLAALIAVTAWRFTKDPSLQAMISLMTPFLSYLPARYLGVSTVLAVVATGLTVSYFTPVVLSARARDRALGFWVTLSFLVNAFIFVLVGMQFREIVAAIHGISWVQLFAYGVGVSIVVIAVRLAWVFGQALLPATNEPEHSEGKADWSHVAVLAWSGMRGGISLAAALAIPLETAAGPFPQRALIIFLTFCVLLATLVGQGGTLPLILRWFNVRDDGTDVREERIALAHTAKAALKRLDEIEKTGTISDSLLRWLRGAFADRWAEYSEEDAQRNMRPDSDQYRHVSRDLINAQRDSLIRLLRRGEVDNTVMRRIQRLLDLDEERLDLLESTGRTDMEGG